MRQLANVMSGVCFSVCYQLYVKTTERIFTNFTTDLSVVKKELVKFWK